MAGLLLLRPVLGGNAAVALLAAVAWGGGDFSGGMGVKAARSTAAGAVRFVMLAHALSLGVLLLIFLVSHAPLPQGAGLWWAIGGGAAAGLSLVAFYIALARGAMGASAALSGVIAAAIPALVSAWLEGAPHALALAGFLLAGAAIWIIAAAPAASVDPKSADASDPATTLLALLGGLGFGIYFTALRFANGLGVLQPIFLARVGSLLACGLLLLVLRRGADEPAFRVSRSLLGWAVGAAVLDTGGNLLFTWATRLGRLDVAAVLASLYPASTILLAAWRLHERPTRRQWIGMGLALVAVVLITT